MESAWHALIFRKEKLLYLYCLDTEDVFELTVPSLPFLKLKCLFGHVSLPGALSERRIAVFPQCERALEKLKDVVSPCVIEVTASVDFQVSIFLLVYSHVYEEQVTNDSLMMLFIIRYRRFTQTKWKMTKK